MTLPQNTIMQDIKFEKITQDQLEEMLARSGSYESLFSKRAMKYRALGLDKIELSESDYRDYILKEYTFLKRPVFVLKDQIFIGSAKKTIDELKRYLLT